MYVTQPTLFILGKDFVQPSPTRYSEIVGSKLYQGTPFIVTDICKNMALRDGMASATINMFQYIKMFE